MNIYVIMELYRNLRNGRQNKSFKENEKETEF